MNVRSVVPAPQAPPRETTTAFRTMRVGIRALSAVAPRLAARVAERLWFSPPRPHLRDYSRDFLATGERFDVMVDERRVVAWRWGRGPTILLMHGWGGFGAQMYAFVEPLVAAGFGCVAFDAPSHGQSGPSRFGERRATLFEFAETLVALARPRDPVAGVIAHSGGATAAAWSIGYFRDWTPPPMVFVAPMASPITYKRLFHEALGLDERARRIFDERTEARFGFRWPDLEVPAMAGRMKTPPVLVVHDREDRETAWTESASIAEAWPGAEEYYTTGLGHRRVLRDPGVVERVVSFLREPR